MRFVIRSRKRSGWLGLVTVMCVAHAMTAIPAHAHGGEGAIAELLLSPFFLLCNGLQMCGNTCGFCAPLAADHIERDKREFVVPPCILSSSMKEEMGVICPAASALFDRKALEADRKTSRGVVRRPEDLAALEAERGLTVDASLMHRLDLKVGRVQGDLSIDTRGAAAFSTLTLNATHVEGDLILFVGARPFAIEADPGSVDSRVVLIGDPRATEALRKALHASGAAREIVVEKPK